MLEFMRSIRDRQQSVTGSTIRFSAPSADELATRGSYSQLGQDLIVLLLASGSGTFADIGAHDGLTGSNTKLLEERGWTGVNVEPNPEVFDALLKNRRTVCLQNAVGERNEFVEFTAVSGYAETPSDVSSSYPAAHRERIAREIQQHGGSLKTVQVEQISVSEVFARANLPSCDYLSIDVEGAEDDVCRSLLSSQLRPKLVSVENNYGTVSAQLILRGAGYKHFFSLEWDDFFLHESVPFLPWR